MDITIILELYVALYIVMILHELGHLPDKINFKFGILPNASAMNARSRYGGLIVNLAIMLAVSFYNPDNQILIFVGLISWIHFLLYVILGSFIPQASSLNYNSVLNDVSSEHKYTTLFIAFMIYLIFSPFFIPIVKGLFI